MRIRLHGCYYLIFIYDLVKKRTYEEDKVEDAEEILGDGGSAVLHHDEVLLGAKTLANISSLQPQREGRQPPGLPSRGIT
jgi:hypothetical protein